MAKYSFKNDYAEGAHPKILNALLASNLDQEEGYGLDSHSEAAIALIQGHLHNPNSQIHLISGGTQTNLIAIGAFLRPHHAVVAPATGHISTHETGAIEATGHKIITVDCPDGKLTPEQIQPVLIAHHFEHMVKPRLVYISNPTELGTVYSRTELHALYEFCQERDLLLYCDGARLGAALTAKGNDLSLSDMAHLTHAFFIGGTKIGALLGEALVINDPTLQEDMRYAIKQRGALMAKGRLLGIQFETLFTDNLYLDLASHGNEMAQKMARGIAAAGYDFLIPSPTNQIFPILPNDLISRLQDHYNFFIWKAIDEDHSAIRLITSWATPQSAVEKFLMSF